MCCLHVFYVCVCMRVHSPVCASVHRYQPRNPVPLTDWTVETLPSKPADLSDGRSQELLSEGSPQEHVPQRSHQSGPDNRSAICVCEMSRCYQWLARESVKACVLWVPVSLWSVGGLLHLHPDSCSQRFCGMWSNTLYTVCLKGPLLQPELVPFKGQCLHIYFY